MEIAKSSAKQVTESGLGIRPHYRGGCPHCDESSKVQTALNLRHLAQILQPNSTEDSARRSQALLTFQSLRRLRDSRPRLIRILRWTHSLGLTQGRAKLALWRQIACADSLIANFQDHAEDLREALKKTEAWKESHRLLGRRNQRRIRALWNHRGRIHQPDQLLNSLQQCIEKDQRSHVVFWHHYDERGFVPKTWLRSLQALRREGWLVVVSSSHLSERALQELEASQLLISQRQNLGLCLGAYRDFCCLLQERPALLSQLNCLVLANDSTLPVQGEQSLAGCFKEMRIQLEQKIPRLGGLTDSIERELYHLQSYLLMANAPLLSSKIWERFWRELDISGDKDTLIDRGEIGLSQSVIADGGDTWARHSLISMLANTNGSAQELTSYNIYQLRDVNLTLFAWQSLLRNGCPLIKKQVLFNPPSLDKSVTKAIPLTQLQSHLQEADPDLLNDIEALLRSRHLSH